MKSDSGSAPSAVRSTPPMSRGYDWRLAVLTLEPLPNGRWQWGVKSDPVLINGGLAKTPFLASGEERSRRKAIRKANEAVARERKAETLNKETLRWDTIRQAFS